MTAQRALRAPADVRPAEGQRTSFAFTRGPQPRYACMSQARVVQCDAGLTRFGEEPAGVHRLFTTTARTTYEVGGTVLPASGGSPPVALGALTVAASTQLAGDVGAAPLGAIDDDRTTTWIADETDQRPTLRLNWDGPRTVRGLTLTTTPGSGASAPLEVQLTSSAGTVRRPVAEDGTVEFAGRTDKLEITVLRIEPGMNGPAGISTVEVAGVTLPDIRPDTPVRVPCGAGPVVRVDGRDYDTTVSGTVAAVTEHRTLPLTTCDDLAEGLDLGAGDHELRTTRTADFVVQDVWLRPADAAPAPVHQRAVTEVSWGAVQRELRVADGPASVLVVRENANDGWVATANGEPLTATRVDGWQQAWFVPAGATTVVIEFVPDGTYRNRLLVGAGTALLVLAAAFVPGLRRPRRPGPSTRPGEAGWVPWALVVLLVLLGGMAGLVSLLAILFVRSLVPHYRRAVSMAVAFGGMAAATVISVTGRLLDHGQDWAYGTAAQASILVALAAVVSVRIRWFERA